MMNEVNELIEKLTELLEQDKFLDNKFSPFISTYFINTNYQHVINVNSK